MKSRTKSFPVYSEKNWLYLESYYFDQKVAKLVETQKIVRIVLITYFCIKLHILFFIWYILRKWIFIGLFGKVSNENLLQPTLERTRKNYLNMLHRLWKIVPENISRFAENLKTVKIKAFRETLIGKRIYSTRSFWARNSS